MSSNKTESFYDVVVLGDELAAAVSAALLARRGYRVLVLCSRPIEEETVGKHTFPRSPLALTGLEAPTLKRVATELNLVQLLRRKVVQNHPAYQVLLPDHRIDVGDDVERELQRELPDELPRLEQWGRHAERVSSTLEPILARGAELPPDGFWANRELRRAAAPLPTDAELDEPLASSTARLLVELPARFAADLAPASAVARARLADLHRRATWNFAGGREGLRALFLEKVRTSSGAGDVRHDLPARGLVLRRGRIVGVAIGDRDQVVGCDQTVCGLPADRLVTLLPEEPPRRLREAAAIQPALFRYRLHLVAPLEAVPDALGPLAFSVRDPSAPLEGANALSLQVAEAQGQHAVLTATALTRDASPEALKLLRAAVIAHLDALLPFLDRHVLATWSPHQPENPTAATVALPLDPIWSFPEPGALGVCGLGHNVGLKGLVLSSRQVVPGLGLEGEMAAGWGAALLVTSRHKRKEINKSELLVGP